MALFYPVGHQIEIIKLCLGESLAGFNVMINDKCLSQWQPHRQGWWQVSNGTVPGKLGHRVTVVLMAVKKSLWPSAHGLECGSPFSG